MSHQNNSKFTHPSTANLYPVLTGRTTLQNSEAARVYRFLSDELKCCSSVADRQVGTWQHDASEHTNSHDHLRCSDGTIEREGFYCTALSDCGEQGLQKACSCVSKLGEVRFPPPRGPPNQRLNWPSSTPYLGFTASSL